MNWRSLLGFGGTVLFVAALAYYFDWTTLARSFSNLSLTVIAGALACSLVSVILLSMRWAVLAAPSTVTIGWREFRDAFLAQSVSLLTPAAVGADAYRIIVAVDREGGRSRAVGLVLFERVVSVAVYAYMFVAAFIVASFEGPVGSVFSIAALCFAVFGAGFILAMVLSVMFAQKIAAWVMARGWEKLALILEAATIVDPSRVFLSLLISALATGSWLMSIVILGFTVDIGLTVADLAMTGIVTDFARLLPISVQGIGVREAVFSSLAHEAGGDPTAALVTAATAYVLLTVIIVCAGAVARFTGGVAAKSRYTKGRSWQ